MKKILFIAAMLLSISVSAQKINSFYDFTVKDINGDDFPLSQLKGKKVLVVNTASKCGFTPQYEDLEKLYKTYSDRNFVIIGFPSNDFLKQEPGSNREILEFCQKNYGVTFPMMSKISVKGANTHPLYQWLTEKTNTKVSWNFQKYLIDENGYVVGSYSPGTKPTDQKIIDWITQ